MTHTFNTFTDDPSRNNCELHLSLNDIDSGNITDFSPQAHGGRVVGSPDEVSGVVGPALEFDGKSDGVLVRKPRHALADRREFTISVWVNLQDTGNRGDIIDVNPYFTLSENSGSLIFRYETTNGSSSLTTTVSNLYDDWKHLAVNYDGEQIRVYVDKVRVTEVAETDALVNTTGNNTSIAYNDNADDYYLKGYVDDPRLYREWLSEHEIDAIYGIGARHESVDKLQVRWPTDGIPFKGNNVNLAGTLAEQKDYIFRHLDYIRQSLYAKSAAGEQLDRIGNLIGLRRQTDESDPLYRARIEATVIAGRSSGTFKDILDAVTTILDSDVDNVTIQRDDLAIATAEIYVLGSDLDDADISASDLATVLQDVVAGGHAVEVFRRGENPFTVIDDTQVSTAENGLTSDSTPLGGGLASDI